MHKNKDREEPIVRFKQPKELEEIIDFDIPKTGVSFAGTLININRERALWTD